MPIKVVYIPCLFEEKRYEFETYNLKIPSILISLVQRFPEIRNESANLTIRVNGKKLSPFQWKDKILTNEDRVTIIQEPGWESIAAIGTALGIWGGTTGGVLGISAATITTVVTVLNIATLVASIAFSIYSAVSSPDTPRTGMGLKNSPTYGWNAIAMQIKPGVPVPVVYGEHIVPGNLISCFVSTNGEDNYLNMLIALAEGEIEGILKADGSGVCASISDTPLIYINDNLFSNFQGIAWDYRLGTESQAPINGFDDIKHVYNAGPFEIDFGVDYLYTTVDLDIEAYEVRFRCPGFYWTWHGNYYPRKAKFSFYHRVNGTSDWTYDGQLEIKESTTNAVRRYFRKDGLSANHYDIKVVRESVSPWPDPPEQAGPRDTYIDNITEIKYDALIYPHTALLALKILASARLSGQIPNVLPVIRGRKVKNLDTGQTVWTRNPIYNVNDCIVTERFGLGRYITQANINNDQLIGGADHSDELVGDGNHRGIASITSTSLTTTIYDFVAGDIGKTICCVSPSDSAVYTKLVITSIAGKTATGTGGWSNGIPVVAASGWEWGEKRFELDMVLDVQDQAMSVIQRMCASFRASPIWTRDAIQIGIDKKDTPSYIFTMGNVLQGSFKYSFVSAKQKPNVINLEYLDRNKKFQKVPADVSDSSALTAGAVMRSRSLPLFGATRRSQIYREGRFHMLAAKHQDEQIQFGGGMDAIHSWPMEVIKFQHDVPQWGYGGRIVSATLNTIAIDREVEIQGGFTYVVTVKKPEPDGTEILETRTVTNGVGFYTMLSVTPDFSAIPEADGLYSFGKLGIEAKSFRIMSIQRNPEMSLQVMASEYQDAVHVDTGVILPDVQYSDLPTSMICPQVEDLSVSESGTILDDGTWAGFLEIGFRIPEVPYFLGWDHAEVWISLDPDLGYQHYGNTTKNLGYTIEGHNYLKIGNTVYVKVVLVTKTSLRSDFDTAPRSTILIAGKTSAPSDVTGFTAVQMGDRIMISWEPPIDRDIIFYEIREGPSWETGQIIGRNIVGIPWSWLYFSADIYHLMIKAVDRTGNYSATEAAAEITVLSVPTGNLMASLDGLLAPSAYSNTTRQQSSQPDIYGKSLVIGLSPSQGWDDAGTWDDASKWDVPVASTTGYFETDIIDFGLLSKVNILVDDDYILEGGTQSAGIQIKTSPDNISWGSYATFIPGEYYCRYAKFKISLTTSSVSYNIFVTNFLMKGYQAGIMGVNFSNQTIAVGGTVITFGITFAVVPSVIVTPIGSTLLVEKVTSKTTTGCTVQLYNMSSTDVGGVADIIIQGQ